MTRTVCLRCRQRQTYTTYCSECRKEAERSDRDWVYFALAFLWLVGTGITLLLMGLPL